MNYKRIWVIEDMLDLKPVYQSVFDNSEYKIDFFQSFNDFKNKYTQSSDIKPDLSIVDINLQDGNFFQLLNESDVTLTDPFIVVSKSNELPSFELAFEAGAIDYLLKPINNNELLAKVSKHLKSIEKRIIESSKTLKSLNLDIQNYTNKEIKIIESFNFQDDKTLHRSEIVKIIWKNIAIHPNTLDVHIYNLRKKLKKDGHTIKAIGNGHFKFMSLTEQ